MGKRGISPLIAALILIAITIVGGVVVYRLFFSSSGVISSNLHVVITDASLSSIGGLTLTVKNDGNVAITQITSCTVVDPIGFVGASNSSNTGATSLTIIKPTGVVAGHVMVSQITVRGGTGTTITPPAGWTLIRSDSTSGNEIKQSAYYLVVGISEPNSYTWTFNSSQKASGGIATYSGVDNTNPIDTHGGQANPSSTLITAPSVTTTVASTMLVGLFGTATVPTITAPSGMAERWNVASTMGASSMRTRSEGADATFAGPGATGSKNATSGPAALNIGQLVALTPEPTPTTTTTTTTNTTTTLPGTSVTGCGTFTFPGPTLDPGESTSVTTTVGGVLAGKSYTIKISVLATDGSSASTSVSITAV